LKHSAAQHARDAQYKNSHILLSSAEIISLKWFIGLYIKLSGAKCLLLILPTALSNLLPCKPRR
jgi:hypothetical protein